MVSPKNMSEPFLFFYTNHETTTFLPHGNYPLYGIKLCLPLLLKSRMHLMTDVYASSFFFICIDSKYMYIPQIRTGTSNWGSVVNINTFRILVPRKTIQNYSIIIDNPTIRELLTAWCTS